MSGSLLESTLNTRDLGGYATADGRRTKYGSVWRSDVPQSLTARDLRFLQARGMTEIIDLRRANELQRVPSAFAEAEGLRVHWFPIVDGSHPPKTLAEVPETYMQIATAPSMPGVFRTIAEAEGGVLVHCTAGKDRTGVVSAILLLACGVARVDIIRDYVVSRENNRERLERYLCDHPDIKPEVVLANEASMEGFLELFLARFGGVRQYFAALGLPESHFEAVREKLIETLPSGKETD